jgi:ATP-GRASP peptide maturase of grasp-with-spasm system
MILILSQDAYEQGTDPVISWLLYYKADFLKISVGDFLKTKINYCVDIDKQDIVLNNISFRDKIKTIWHRRFMNELNTNLVYDSIHAPNLRAEMRKEIEVFTEYLSIVLKEKKWLTSFNNISINKLEALNIAQECGLITPISRVLNNKKEALKFNNEVSDGLISKTISGSRGHYIKGEDTYVMLTTDMNKEKLDDLPDYFMPTLFQAKVKADFEIRVFYLDKQFFPTAVLTPKNNRSVDRKMSNDTNSTHFVPYQLPKEIMAKLDDFMEKIGLNTGSIDLMKCADNSFVFLEVNPVGQYLAESERCNFKIEKSIAQWLIKQDKS